MVSDTCFAAAAVVSSSLTSFCTVHMAAEGEDLELVELAVKQQEEQHQEDSNLREDDQEKVKPKSPDSPPAGGAAGQLAGVLAA